MLHVVMPLHAQSIADPVSMEEVQSVHWFEHATHNICGVIVSDQLSCHLIVLATVINQIKNQI